MKRFYILIIAQIIGFQAIAQSPEVLQTKVFDNDIKTIQLYPAGGNVDYPTLRPTILTIGSGEKMLLEFDDLRASYRQFHVKIQHCGFDWQASTVRDLEYLNEYNDFIINDYQVSQNTKINYFHYGFALPEIKLSGNYILLLFEDYISEQPLAQMRFSVLDPKVGVSGNISAAQDPSLWRTHQQVNFELNYGNYQIRNPRSEFKIIIRQNFREETIKGGFQPTMVNAARRNLTFRFFNNENVFEAGNEFRYADLRSTFNKGYNIEQFKQGVEDEVWLRPQETRANKTYLEARDLNGRYLVETLNESHSSISADYVHVIAGFKSLELPSNQRLCIFGGFNQYVCEEIGEMQYEAAFAGYTTELLLKQGLYDFQFAILEDNRRPDFSFFEGNFSETKNSYEVFVYHKPPAARSELLVGYALIEDR